MSCGCELPTIVVATRAAMCATCRDRLRAPGGDTCALTGTPDLLKVSVTAPRKLCYANRWPDANGFVRWMGCKWVGVPDPLRWLLFLRLGREPRLGGCGCDLKLLTEHGPLWRVLGLSPLLRRWIYAVISHPDVREAWDNCRGRFAT